ncbi:major histocompatibility complex class I-related gene protein-like [Ahaetulla prasina]|uniref:major histocompatibility complex class I-related gene protein-like n=1 Tax=Ahaetulla prasina TaxID=499056 RepID=UPI0026497678|nr:major histocompatibility complex class I-related gene protein-like [Ahaetulla prasina]
MRTFVPAIEDPPPSLRTQRLKANGCSSPRRSLCYFYLKVSETSQEQPCWWLKNCWRASFFLHSLSYFYLQLAEPSQGLPQFFIRSYLDDQPIARYDSLTRKMQPLVPWMEEEEAEKEAFLAPEWIFRADLEKLSKRNHQAEGLHTWQAVLGCELWEDGSKGGFLHYGYDGTDFISFDKETLRWKTAQHQAQKLKEKWEDDPGWSERNKFFLEKTCIEGLQRYLSHKNKTLQRTEPLVGKVTRKVADDSLEVLICQAFGFYPKEIQAIWMKDGEVCEYETLHKNVAPNSDGTYYVRLSIEINPKERERFQCHLEHEGLQEPLVLALKEEKGFFTPLSYFYLQLAEPSQASSVLH